MRADACSPLRFSKVLNKGAEASKVTPHLVESLFQQISRENILPSQLLKL